MVENARSKSTLPLTVVAVVVVLIIAVAFVRPWHKQEEDFEHHIKVAYLPIYVDLPLFVAQREKIFRQQGVRVEMIRFQSSPDMAAALVGGRVDAVASIATHSALAVESRDPGRFQIFLVDEENSSAPLSSLLVQKDSEINTVADLKGKTLASFPGPTTQIWAPLALEALGLSRNDYTIQALEIGSHLSALETNRVDAIVTYEPTATQAEIDYGAKRLVNGLIESTVIEPWQAGIWIIDRDFLSRKEDTARLFVNSIYEAVDLIRKDPDRAKESLEEFTSVNMEIALKTPPIPFAKAYEADKVVLQKHADILARNGALSKEVMVAPLFTTVFD